MQNNNNNNWNPNARMMVMEYYDEKKKNNLIADSLHIHFVTHGWLAFSSGRTCSNTLTVKFMVMAIIGMLRTNNNNIQNALFIGLVDDPSLACRCFGYIFINDGNLYMATYVRTCCCSFVCFPSAEPQSYRFRHLSVLLGWILFENGKRAFVGGR